MVSEQNYIDLLSLQRLVRESVEDAFPGEVWVRAEIAGIGVKANGHCYLELSQSDDSGVVARTRAVIWRTKYALLKPYFEQVTGSSLQTGMEVLVKVQVSYHEVWGFTLVVSDINPEFTLGEREARRRATVERLREEGLLDLQKELALPDLPYYLAVISAENAAGFGDFKRHLLGNEYGFAYQVDLFPAAMQGRDAPASICAALRSISESDVNYDAVLILRGGGSELDLACFDDYDLAAAIAQFPSPVFTAIGHDRDYHVADMVANTFVKTPTALADLFLECTAAEDERIASCGNRLRLAFMAKLHELMSGVDGMASRILAGVVKRLDGEEAAVKLLETKISMADPANVLRKGYSLVLDGGGVRIRGAAGRKAGDRISVVFPDGRLDCRIEGIRPVADMPSAEEDN